MRRTCTCIYTPTHMPDDKRNGRGTFTIAETGDKYDGEWKNGKVCTYVCDYAACVVGRGVEGPRTFFLPRPASPA